jgi:hypothetical protein
MNVAQKQAFIQYVSAENQPDASGVRIRWSRHAVTALIEDGLRRGEVETALIHCTVIEDYPTQHRPLPDCLVLGYISPGKPVHVGVAVEVTNDRIFIVTVYLPSENEWENDWTTRK